MALRAHWTCPKQQRTTETRRGIHERAISVQQRLQAFRPKQVGRCQRGMRHAICEVLLFVYRSTVRCLEGFEHRQRLRTIVGKRDRSVCGGEDMETEGEGGHGGKWNRSTDTEQ